MMQQIPPTQKIWRSLSLGILLVLPVGPSEGAALKPGAPAFIQNGEIRLGVDLGSGGGVFYFSERSPERNLLNHYDKGRFIQQSYYGVKDGSLWAGKPWRWNPVQGGGYKGQPAKVLDSSVQPDSLYVKTLPKHWATGEDIPAATMEETIDLKGRVAHIHFKFSYTGDVDNPPSHQELPAVFMDYALPHLIFYSGSKPWSGGELTRVIPGFPNEKQLANENWAAYVDDTDWGMGVYFPGTTQITSYRAKANLTAGPEGQPVLTSPRFKLSQLLEDGCMNTTFILRSERRLRSGSDSSRSTTSWRNESLQCRLRPRSKAI